MHDQRLGTAEWSDPVEFSRQHAFKEGDFWLGRSTEDGQPLGYSDDRHVCLVSGTRSGKGTSVIIPNLCLWPGSVVVVDPKGENATVTAARRGSGDDQCEGMGQRVHVLDPFEVAKVDSSYRSRFNPLDALDPSDPATLDEAGRLADAIVIQNPQSNDPFWDQSARAMVKGLILHVLTDPMFEGRRNLITVRELIARGDHDGVRILREELGEANPVSAQALLWRGVSQNNALGGKIAAVGENMASMIINSSKQYESVLQVANRNTEFLDSPGMESVLCASDFNLSDLKTNANGVSLYLSLPQRYMGEHFRWLRMMISLIITEMEAVPGQPASGHRVLMCLDEFAGLKKMEIIESAVAQIAGYGIKLFFALQSLEQFKSVYQDNWETFLSNAGLKIFFGLEDNFSREYVSKLAGETEIVRELESSGSSKGESESESTGTQTHKGGGRSDSAKGMPLFLRDTGVFMSRLIGRSGAHDSTSWGSGEQSGSTTGSNYSESRGRQESVFKRPLITPDEVGRYFSRVDDFTAKEYPGLGLIFLAGNNISPVQRVNYFEDDFFAKIFAHHPDHSKSTVNERLVIELMSEKSFNAFCALDNRFAKGVRVDCNYDLETPGVNRHTQRGRIRVGKGEVIRCGGLGSEWQFDLLSPCTGELEISGDKWGNTASILARSPIDKSIMASNAQSVRDFANQEIQFMMDYNKKNWGKFLLEDASLVPMTLAMSVGGIVGVIMLLANWNTVLLEISDEPGIFANVLLVIGMLVLLGVTLWAVISMIIISSSIIPALIRGKRGGMCPESQKYLNNLYRISEHANEIM